MPNFLGLGAWTISIIRPLFNSFTDENVAPALALIIFAIAIGLCFLFVAETTYIRIQIRRRTNAIKTIPSKSDFFGAIQSVQALMMKSGYLRHSWEQFRETLIEPQSDSHLRSLVILNTSRPHDYFNMAEARLRFSVYKTLPNVLVGVGLLLTFFGLVSALCFTTAAISNSTDPKVTQDALRDLLHAASFKFYTSIAGLGGSIVLTLVLRHGTSRLENYFDDLAFALETKLQFVTPESIAFNTYREAQEQTKALRTFNTEVAVSVGKRIEEALTASLPGFLAQAMAPIEKSLNDVAGKLTSMNEGAIGQMAGDFVDKLQGAAGTQMQGIADTLGQLRSSIENLNRQLAESGTALADKVGSSTGDMRTAATDMTSLLQEAGANLKEVAGTITDALHQTTSRMATSTERASQQFEAASGRSAKHIEDALSSIISRLQNETAGLGAEVTKATIAAGDDSRKHIVDAGAQLAESLSGLNSKLSDAVGRMSHALENVAAEMGNAERGIAAHVGNITELSRATKETESAITGTARTMREAGAPLAESTRLIAEASRSISDATGNAERSIVGAQTQISNIGRLLEDTLRSTTQQWVNYEQRFKGVDDSLGIALDRIVSNVRENLEILGTFVQTVDEKLSSAVDRLGGGIDELGDIAQSIEKANVRLNGGIHHNA
jgi:methyl-accepting chemotaxis protein